MSKLNCIRPIFICDPLARLKEPGIQEKDAVRKGENGEAEKMEENVVGLQRQTKNCLRRWDIS